MSAALKDAAVVPGVRIADVRVGERARKDYGDLESLKKSITEHGLLQPIVLLPDNWLLCGGRRLQACRELGWDSIPAVWSQTQTDAVARLKAERDENTCRKDMTISELVALGKKLEELERPKALARQGTRTDLTSSPREEEVGRPTDKVIGDAIGLSGTSYWRAKHVIDTADDTAKPEPVRAAAAEARDAMDVGKLSIGAAARKVKEAETEQAAPTRNRPLAERLRGIRERAPRGMTAQQIAKEIGTSEERVRDLAREHNIDLPAERVMAKTRRLNHTKFVRVAVEQIATAVDGLDVFDPGQVDWSDQEDWVASLTSSVRALNRFVNQVRKGPND